MLTIASCCRHVQQDSACSFSVRQDSDISTHGTASVYVIDVSEEQVNNVTCCLKTGIVESDRKLISWTTASIPRQRLCKQLLSLQRISSDKMNVFTQNENTSPWQRLLLTVKRFLSNQIVAGET
jgi:hypothetical protein